MCFWPKKEEKKNSITRRWLSLKPPGLNDWIRTFLEIFAMEKGFLSVNTKLKSPPDFNKSAAPRADFTRSHWLPTVFVCIFPLAAAVKEAIVPVNSYFVLYEGSKCSIRKLLGVNIFQAPWCWRRNGAPHQLMWHIKYCKHIYYQNSERRKNIHTQTLNPAAWLIKPLQTGKESDQ